MSIREIDSWCPRGQRPAEIDELSRDSKDPEATENNKLSHAPSTNSSCEGQSSGQSSVKNNQSTPSRRGLVNPRPVEGAVVPCDWGQCYRRQKRSWEGHEQGRLLHLWAERPLRQQQSPERPAKKLVASVLAISWSILLVWRLPWCPPQSLTLSSNRFFVSQYSVRFHEETVQVLFGLGSEVNLMHQSYTEKLGLGTEKR